jgi:putative multicomponent Na+:H+ antiporter subunit B
MNDSYIYIIVALLPLAALMLTVQVNPYHALVIRGILGAVAALVYAVLGAADVALTEALVGTMLAITLNAVAVRSSLVMRLGILEDKLLDAEEKLKQKSHDCLFASLVNDLRTVANKHHLRLELVPYADSRSLNQALMQKEIHATCVERSPHPKSRLPGDSQPYQTTTRIRRLYEIFQTGLSPSTTCLTYVTTSDSGEKH